MGWDLGRFVLPGSRGHEFEDEVVRAPRLLQAVDLTMAEVREVSRGEGGRQLLVGDLSLS